jgi:hypothetical protein
MYLLLLIQLLSSGQIRPAHEVNEISGVIISEDTKKPVDKAYVYIVKGEEEATSSADGTFRFTTWQDKPAQVYIYHKNFKSRVIALHGVYRNLRIVLTKGQ